MAASGGHTPWAMYGQIEEQELPWAKTEIFQADERIAPAGSPERNLTHLIAELDVSSQEIRMKMCQENVFDLATGGLRIA